MKCQIRYDNAIEANWCQTNRKFRPINQRYRVSDLAVNEQ